MALHGNYSVLLKCPGRYFGGSTVSDNRANYNKSGPMRNYYFGDEDLAFGEKNAVPNGYVPPYSWAMAFVAGGMASSNQILGSGTVIAVLAGGRNAEAALTGVGTIVAAGGLIVPADADLTGSGTIAADIRGLVEAEADLVGTGTISGGDLRAKGNFLAAVTGVGSISATPLAEGGISADITSQSELSPQSLAAAVISALNEEEYDGRSFSDLLQDLLSMASGKIVESPTGTFTFYERDDTTPRYVLIKSGNTRTRS